MRTALPPGRCAADVIGWRPLAENMMEVALLVLRLIGAFVFAGVFLASACRFFWLLQLPDSYPNRTFGMCMRVVWMVVGLLAFHLCVSRTPATFFC
jgi:uncharacterized protein YjeT (DUF2065 family)